MAGPLLAVGAFVGGLMSAFGKLQEGDAEYQSAMYQAGVADQDAFLADRNAEYVMDRAKDDYRKLRVMARRELGSMSARIGASGLTGGEYLLEEAAAVFEDDAQNIMLGGVREATSYRLEGQRKRKAAGLLRKGGMNAQAAGQMGAVSSIITGTADAASKMPSGRGAAPTAKSDASDYSYSRYQKMQRIA